MIAALSAHVYRRNILSISSSTLSELGFRLKIVNDEGHGFHTPYGKPIGGTFDLILASSMLADFSIKPLVTLPISPPLPPQ
jgi:hypothetical protein